MSKRLGYLGLVMLVLFAILAGMTAYLQFSRKPVLDASPLNPRVIHASRYAPRGDIVAADGELLAHSVRSGVSGYPWRRIYPLGSLTSGIVGYTSDFYGDWALESEYASTLVAHKQPAQSWAQVLAPSTGANTLNITLQPALQRVAQAALAGRDGAVVALNPSTGAVLAMYSNPTFDPKLITVPTYGAEKYAFALYTRYNAHHFQPLGLLATQQTFPPGSTMKVVTTASAILNKPSLMLKSYPYLACTKLPSTNKVLCNDGGSPCGGTVQVMLPYSCDPGYGLMGLDLGGEALSSTAQAFGYDQKIPLDLPGVAQSYFPGGGSFKYDQPQLAYSAIGQENVRASALSNALVAAGIANGGTIMIPHLIDNIVGPDGRIIQQFKATPWLTPMTPAQAGRIVPLMEAVARYGTAGGVGFLYQDDVAAKTGTAQTGNALHNTDDWMIAFAPARHPVVAVAVVVPYQAISAYGATIAGPIVKCVIEGAIALSKGLPASNTATTCHQ